MAPTEAAQRGSAAMNASPSGNEPPLLILAILVVVWLAALAITLGRHYLF